MNDPVLEQMKRGTTLKKRKCLLCGESVNQTATGIRCPNHGSVKRSETYYEETPNE